MLGISADLCNYIDFDTQTLVAPLGIRGYIEGDENEPIYLTDGTITIAPGAPGSGNRDLSNVLDWDGTIEVEGGGHIEFVNENNMAVPVELSYFVKLL